MRVAYGCLAVLAVCLPWGATVSARQPMGSIWHRGGDAIVVVPCPPGGDTDDTCRALAARHDGRLMPLGSGYMSTHLLWAGRASATAPDAVVVGDGGGSGGYGDLFAVTFGRSTAVRRLEGERMDAITARQTVNGLHLTLPFNIEFFHGAPHAGASISPLPVVWAHGDFAVDFARLLKRPTISAADRAAMRRDLRHWVREGHMAEPYGIDAVNVLTPLLLSGRAGEARQLLHHVWSTGPQDEEAFWTELCSAVVRHPWWTRFDLKRIPDAARILAAARRAKPQA